jgi:hypothetical protein
MGSVVSPIPKLMTLASGYFFKWASRFMLIWEEDQLKMLVWAKQHRKLLPCLSSWYLREQVALLKLLHVWIAKNAGPRSWVGAVVTWRNEVVRHNQRMQEEITPKQLASHMPWSWYKHAVPSVFTWGAITSSGRTAFSRNLHMKDETNGRDN